MDCFTPIGIHIIGLGVSERAHLVPHAEIALGDAEVVIGSERQLETVRRLVDRAFNDVEKIALPPLKELATLLDSHTGKRIVILASGDPLYYGIGRWLSKRYGHEQLYFYPGISSIQAACHSIGLSLQDAQVVSLHGRPPETVRRHLAQHQYLVTLTDKHSTPQTLALECLQAGFDESSLWVCEKLGYEDQQVRQFTVSELLENSKNSSLKIDSPLAFDPLHITIIQVIGKSNYLPSFPGIADADFITDGEPGKGLITKREVRLSILSLLQAAPDDVAWDIGAGCGGVAVEWALWNPLGQVYAIEHHATRLDCLAQNQHRFGVVDNLNIVAGRAPEALEALPQANKIFIGGSDGKLPELLNMLWKKLPENGVIVSSAVMESSRSYLIRFADEVKATGKVETLQIAVSRGDELAGQLLYRPALPVTLFKFTNTRYLAKGKDNDASK